MIHIDNNNINDSNNINDMNDYSYGEYDEESMRTTNIKSSLSHINKLIDMAEESNDKIANLFKQMKKSRERMFYLIAVVYTGAGFFAAYITEHYKSFSNYSPSLYTSLSVAIVFCILIFSSYAFLKQRSNIKRQIAIERYILKDILSLVFDIRKILNHSVPSGSLWIEFKFVDMRLKRLDFH